MSEQVLKVGIAGQGRSGFDIHAKWLRQAPGQYKIVAVADQIEGRRQQAEKEFGCRVYGDYKQLIADQDLDLLVNALPSYLHPPATIEALEAGHNVVCEKPLATKVKDFDAMVAAAQKSKKLFAPFQNSRFAAFFLKIQEVIASGVLGQIIYIRTNWSGFSRRWDWQTRQDLGGGNLNNTGPHPMDHAIVLYGPKMPKVFSRLECHHQFGGDADDFALVILHGPDGPTVEVLISSYQAFPQGEEFNISGTRGGLTGGTNALKWKYFDPEQAPKQTMWPGWSDNRTYCQETLPWKEESWTRPEGSAIQQSHAGFYNNIYDVLVHHKRLVVQPREVRRQIAAIERCHRANPLPVKAHAAIDIAGQR